MITAIAVALGVAIWLTAGMEFHTYGYVIGDPDAE
jgi:hypothetical protein